MKRRTGGHPKIILPAFLLFMALTAGCGNMRQGGWETRETAGRSTEDGNGIGRRNKGEETRKPETGDGQERDSGEEQSKYVYLEKKRIRDINDRNVICEAYVPKGSEVGGGSAFYSGHGLYYFANTDSFGDASYQYETFTHSYGLMLEYWQGADMDYTEFGSSGVLENGNGRYYILTGKGVDYDGTPYEAKRLYYMEMQSSGASLNWQLEMYGEYADGETDAILCELEECYGICLDAMKTGGRLEPDTENQDVYTVKEGQVKLEDIDGYRYLGYGVLSDYDGTAFCPVFLPKSKGTDLGKDHAYAYLHGVQVIVDVDEIFYGNHLLADMKNDFDIKYESREGNPERIRNLQKKEMVPVPGFEDAVYSVVSYEKKGYGGEYFPKAEVLCYFRFQDKYYLSLEIFLTGEGYDASTNEVIRELETAYGMDLSDYYYEGEKDDGVDQTGADAVTLVKMLGDMEETAGQGRKNLSDTVLWFNATYAPLTYSNGWDWKIVGGLVPTEENRKLDQYLLRSSWNVTDRESAMKQAESLKENGHRQRCREYMEELEKCGLLDLDEDAFQKAFWASDIEDKCYRYELAYQMCREGLDADAMAAWDLCRVNQLYAAYYVCGYMTYEEAMEASLENSLVLQGMYSSWEDMLDGYMLGFRFWRNQAGEDAVAEERQQICDMLLENGNGPYCLDWDMDLEYGDGI